MADNEKRESGDATYVKLQKDASGNWIVGSDMPDIEWEIVDKSRNSKGRVTGIQFGSGNISFDWDVADLLRSSSGYNRDMAIGCLCLSDSVKKEKIDRKVIKRSDRSLIRLGFIGSLSPYKSFPLLKEVCTALQKEGIHNWKLSAWGNRTGINANCDRIVYCDAYKQKQ